MISFAFLISGFALGLASSLHCIGMCGPIALSLPIRSASGRVSTLLLYHLGRLLSYASLGLLVGLLGRGAAIAGYQQFLSIGSGAALLVYLVLSATGSRSGKESLVFGKVQHFIVQHMQQASPIHILLTGIGNGLLPCGVVYLAIATATVSDGIVSAPVFMLFFGLGTVPLMTIAALSRLFVGPRFRNYFRKITPYLTACIALMLILRGLNLGIPYISPMIDAVSAREATISCH